MNLIRAIIIAGAVAACATSPRTYDPQPWAKVSFKQAEAECYNYINSAAGEGSNLYLCMKAKGWVGR
jgi:hypothetical protein